MPVIINDLDIVVDEPAASPRPEESPARAEPIVALDLLRTIRRAEAALTRLEAD